MSDKLEVKIDTSSINKVVKGMVRISKRVREAGYDGVEEFALAVLIRSEDLVPVDTGTLKASTFIDRTEEGVKFGYGGSNDKTNPKTGLKASEYMVQVHEDLEMRHPRGGQAKFFEIPLLELMAQLNDYIIQAIKRRLGI